MEHPKTRDIYALVTRRIIDALEKGVRPWACPWSREAGGSRLGIPRRHNGVPYRGVNALLLWLTAHEQGYRACTWTTFRQAEACGWRVRRGERGTTVVFSGSGAATQSEAGDEDMEAASGRAYRFLRGYVVFNLDQLEGVPAANDALAHGDAGPAPGDLALLDASGADVRHGGSRAFYAPGPDYIQMPDRHRFTDDVAYMGTLAHELVHWTGHPSRLGRDFGGRFGDRAYAVEELVAEIGAAFVCATQGVSPEPREDHAAYIAHWLDVLRADKRAVVSASAQAQRAADYIASMAEVSA